MNAETVKYILQNPRRIFPLLGSKGFMNWLPDELYIKIQFRLAMGTWPDLKNPKTFNEKLQWTKLYDRNPLYTTLVDKYAVRRYIREKIGEEYLIPLVGGPWNSTKEIDFDALPEQFVLKCNHDSGGLVVCRDKKNFDRKAATDRLECALKKNFYWECREWPYKNVKPCIIAEKYMEDGNQRQGLIDYKFFCFNGEPRFMYVSQGLEDHSTAKISFYDLKGRELPFKRTDFAAFEHIPYIPENIDKMVSLAETIAKDVGSSFVRCDLYEINRKIYFSELTFTPCSGLLPFDPPEWDKILGSWIELPARE